MEKQLKIKHMVNKKYNKKRHYELLKQKSMGINLENYSSELQKYSCMLEAHLDWEGREGYLKLLENFQKGKIQDFEFCFAFEERGLLISAISDILESNLILFSPHKKSNHFSSFVSLTIDICRSYLENAEDNDEDSKIEFEIWIAEELFDYLHPFLFLDVFRQKLTKQQFQVLFEIIKTYSSIDIRKEFNITQFLDNYPSVLSNQHKRQIKEYFIQYLKILYQEGKLHDKVLDLSSNKVLQITDLNSSYLHIAVFENINVKFL